MTPRASSRRRSSYTRCCQCKGMLAGVWTALGGAAGSTCISTDGPCIQGNARWGHVLNVEEAYCASNHAFIRALFSAWHGNGSVVGRVGVATRWGQEHGAACAVCGALQPSLRDRVAFMGGGTHDPPRASRWPLRCLSLGSLVVAIDVKHLERKPRLSSDS